MNQNEAAGKNIFLMLSKSLMEVYEASLRKLSFIRLDVS